MSHSSQPAILLLEDGHVFHGYAFGKLGTTSGEICFNTGMTGYQEVFTDPSYYGQVLIMNSVHVGNYGVLDTDVESESVKIRGLIGRNLEELFSRMMAQDTLQSYLEKNNIVGIEGVDTRALVTYIRTQGAMNCIISSDGKSVEELKAIMETVPHMGGLELASKVSTEEPYFIGNPDAPKKVSVLDFGCKRNILHSMAERGVYAKVFPAKTPAAEVLAFNPDGIFISNGPGDPAAMDYAIDTIKELTKAEKPMFGICLGHQLLALAHDIPTYKMHHGHRGLNHPVKNLLTGKSEITTQNHGFGVDPDAVRKADHIEITHVNLNDDSIEGIRVKNKPFFSVQYHPEATPGPHDSRYLFDEFVSMM
ncbi:MAG: glutamine-hydrolyzing carbamoyl-phosphate synthase small subunit [Bacteroidetes bacterium]|jgi:carbamoyl-phosphate synthase small subunit|uniref:glutamine-hydrolyzing carbamoyl-phosphate synthase small subunit n=1 Tax=Phnomibacter sp. TaxID=2836217 RepID=UPI002FDD3C30|nr:glutamine-hydrolyzing carbamoyl-phosphate synthase small subunit [Bacteroidota bacterium]MCC6762409.1 glutamine-hydrolyzing carbamoyl-phosphate synthase small subunit [Chitinophagaceae bacterium]